MTMTTIKLSPLKLLTLGYPVIPSGGGDSGKAPLVGWDKYQSEMPTEDDLERWEREFHPNLWGIVTGEISGVVVVDVDDPALCELFKGVGYPHIKTPRGGFHYWFQYPGHFVKTCAGILPHIDIRGDGGFVNVTGSRKDGEYQTLITPILTALIRWERMPVPILNAMKNGNEHKPAGPAQPGTKIYEHEGRNAALTKEAGRLAGIYHDENIVREMVQAYNQVVCVPPIEDEELEETVFTSVRKWVNTGNNNSFINITSKERDEAKKEQPPEQLGTTSEKQWGKFSEKFDQIMRNAGGGWQSKRDIAEQLGTTSKDRGFRSLLQRRREDDRIRVHNSRPDLIQWINREYQVTELTSDDKQTFLDVLLPLRINDLVKIPPGSVIAIAGYTSSGKTSLLMEAAELNVFSQSMPVYYWYNEMSEDRMKNRCSDFPMLYKAFGEGKFVPARQGDFEFEDVIVPDAINIIDYIDRDDNLYLIGQDIKRLQARLSTGIVIFGLQKPKNRDFGYGGISSAKLSNLYISLDVKTQYEKSMVGEARIVKAKDWVDGNPNGMKCSYHTGGRYGRLFIDSEWIRDNRLEA
ncbi:MAG: bifunctional DNA primase/polymerase [Dehalococcoidales bacterium]|nr:bifunctional DNA primase/polymerase [Dehalococcoidales bacterium]